MPLRRRPVAPRLLDRCRRLERMSIDRKASPHAWLPSVLATLTPSPSALKRNTGALTVTPGPQSAGIEAQVRRLCDPRLVAVQSAARAGWIVDCVVATIRSCNL